MALQSYTCYPRNQIYPQCYCTVSVADACPPGTDQTPAPLSLGLGSEENIYMAVPIWPRMQFFLGLVVNNRQAESKTLVAFK
jgi:hypothetical protein